MPQAVQRTMTINTSRPARRGLGVTGSSQSQPGNAPRIAESPSGNNLAIPPYPTRLETQCPASLGCALRASASIEIRRAGGETPEGDPGHIGESIGVSPTIYAHVSHPGLRHLRQAIHLHPAAQPVLLTQLPGQEPLRRPPLAGRRSDQNLRVLRRRVHTQPQQPALPRRPLPPRRLGRPQAPAVQLAPPAPPSACLRSVCDYTRIHPDSLGL